MALDKASLIAAIKNLSNALKNYDGTSGKTQAEAIDKYANDLADAIDIYVKTAVVSTTVTVVTTCPAGSGVGSGTGTGGVS
jgi:methylthioribose-1-phosphate isomerase